RLTKYLDGTREAAKRWPRRAFIDPFCGPGRIQVEGENFTRDGGAVLAWRQSLLRGAPFSHVLVGDKVDDRVHACSARLQALGAPVTGFVGPATVTVPQMITALPSSTLCTVYLDPYNLEFLSFDIIRRLAVLPTVDFAVHFSVMDLVRNVEFAFEDNPRFDEAAPGWRQAVDVRQLSKEAARREFFEYWLKLVAGLGFQFSKAMPLVKNDSKHPIYRLVFFSRHDLPNRIWGDVAKPAGQGEFNFD
ncbi:three-Cys-motif partner protein TcmP, partial [Hydrogenophaga sp. R2]|uniref:three-Cys-motif partner protein TcmP n=1 Tax=Hydrogenophaga sp. R2 TaxID=3132827 RepID=UPI003CEE8D7A